MRDWAQIHRQVCRRVGMVFQSFNLFPHRTVLENVMEGPVYVLGLARDLAEERARRLLDRVGLSDRLDAMPRQLSGGQQQRVAIARALAMEPQAILFDEPTSALDPRMTAEVLAVMTDLAGDGLTMVVVTHAMQFARRVAHTVHVFGEGRVIESGPPGQIFEDPRAGSDPEPARRRSRRRDDDGSTAVRRWAAGRRRGLLGIHAQPPGAGSLLSRVSAFGLKLRSGSPGTRSASCGLARGRPGRAAALAPGSRRQLAGDALAILECREQALPAFDACFDSLQPGAELGVFVLQRLEV